MNIQHSRSSVEVPKGCNLADLFRISYLVFLTVPHRLNTALPQSVQRRIYARICEGKKLGKSMLFVKMLIRPFFPNRIIYLEFGGRGLQPPGSYVYGTELVTDGETCALYLFHQHLNLTCWWKKYRANAPLLNMLKNCIVLKCSVIYYRDNMETRG